MANPLTQIFDTTGFPPRWYCGDWSTLHGWAHILGDVAIFGAYAAIPLSIGWYAARRKQDLHFPKLYWLFAGFILSCGLTHLIEATIFWHPWYRLSALAKGITAVVSWATVLVLIRALPVAMQIPGTARLNRQLLAEIEERRQSEAAEKEANARLELALDHAGLGTWSWDADTGTCVFSPRALEILELPARERFAPAELISLLPAVHRDRVLAAFREAVEQGGLVTDEYLIERRDYTPRWISVKGRAIVTGLRPARRMSGTIADITDRKLAEAERDRKLAFETGARREAETANRMKDEFLAILSHELRTPLNAILGWVQILQMDETKKEWRQTGLDVIERNARAQARLVDDLLDITAVSSGKISLEFEPVDVRGALNTAAEAILPAAREKSLEILTTVEPGVDGVLADPARLQQILWNLLTNAAKFTPPGGRITLGARREGDHVELSVSDTGEGIDPAFMPHLFDRFRQADSSTTRRHGGLGLGLSLVKTLLEMHGGSVSAESPGLGKGATFRVRLPAADTGVPSPQVADPDSGHTSGGSSAGRLAGLRVLLVEDQAENGEMMACLLRLHGAEVVHVLDGPSALADFDAVAVEGATFDVVVCDVGLPGMDGLELIRSIRAREAAAGHDAVPAIALTGFARHGDRRTAIEAGFDTFLAKPVEIPELLAEVRRLGHRAR